jgi:hypothetical protein
LLQSRGGQHVVVFGPAGRTGAPRRSGRLNITRLADGLVALGGPDGEAEEWIRSKDILYVETDDGLRHGPY